MSKFGLMLRLALAEARHHGIGALLRTLRRQVYRREEFLVYAAGTDEIAEQFHASPNLEIHRATIEEIYQWQRDPALWAIELWWRELKGTQICYLAYWDGKPAHIHWLSTSSESNPYFELKPNEAMTGPSLTYPWARGRGISPQTIAYMAKDYMAQGIRTFYACVETGNTSSQRSVQKAGMTPTGSLIRTGRALSVRWKRAT